MVKNGKRNKYVVEAQCEISKSLFDLTNSKSPFEISKSFQHHLEYSDPNVSSSLCLFHLGDRAVNIQFLYAPTSNDWGNHWFLEKSAFLILGHPGLDTDEVAKIVVIVGRNHHDFRLAAGVAVDWLLNKLEFDELQKKHAAQLT